MSAPYDRVMSMLPDLTKEQLAAVRNHAAALISVGGAPKVVRQDPSLGDRDDWILDGIYVELSKRGQARVVIPRNVFLKTGRGTAYRNSSEPVRLWLEAALPRIQIREKRQLGIICARSLALYLSAFTEVSLQTLTRHIHKMPAAIDASFPGYLESGLLDKVIRSEDKEHVGQPG